MNPEFAIDLSTPELRREYAEYLASTQPDPVRYVDFHPAKVEASRYRPRRRPWGPGLVPVVRASDGAVWSDE
ncbi:hypothetical protein ABT213_29840 [Streptomyces sp. NPDC001674]|uniref:hypothetical protein n=1 Tax=Streptomyces sp. NPDC001674 TaxID=3154394 RepID=UPI0033316CBB